MSDHSTPVVYGYVVRLNSKSVVRESNVISDYCDSKRLPAPQIIIDSPSDTFEERKNLYTLVTSLQPSDILFVADVFSFYLSIPETIDTLDYLITNKLKCFSIFPTISLSSEYGKMFTLNSINLQVYKLNTEPNTCMDQLLAIKQVSESLNKENESLRTYIKNECGDDPRAQQIVRALEEEVQKLQSEIFKLEETKEVATSACFEQLKYQIEISEAAQNKIEEFKIENEALRRNMKEQNEDRRSSSLPNRAPNRAPPPRPPSSIPQFTRA